MSGGWHWLARTYDPGSFCLDVATIRVNPPTWSQWAIFLGGKLSHCIIRFFIPLMLVPWPYVVAPPPPFPYACPTPPSPPPQLLYNVIAEICGSYWLALIFQTSHVISEVGPPLSPGGGGAAIT